MATYEKLDYGSDDGSQWGSSTDLLAFYGAVPSTQYATVGAASTYATYQQSTITASTWGFDSQAALTSFILQVSTLTVALKRLGVIA
jgi:hypothetical protein